MPSGKYKVLRVGNFYTNDSWYYSDLELDNKYYANDGDLLYTWSATFGPHIWRGDKVIYHYHIWKIDLTDKLEKHFAVQLLEQDKNDILSGYNGSTMAHITKEGMEQKKVVMPKSIGEQRQIGLFFDNLDNLITLHQRKYEKLLKIKKSMLENMFPKNGEMKPKIRFKGFTDDWEQREFGEVFKEYTEKNYEDLPVLSIIQGGGTVLREESDRALQYNQNSLLGYKMVRRDDFILHLRSFEGGLEKASSNGIISPAYHTFHGNNTDSRFYYQFFRSSLFINVLLKPHVYGIRDGKSIDINGMNTIMIPVPSYEEQEKIGAFIESIDRLITLHQRKLEKLKKLKKSMLENMFA